MGNIITGAFLLLFFFTFVFNSTDWGLKIMKTENQVLVTRVDQYQEHNDSLVNSELGDLKIGELE